jgi:hypothetical protein
VCGLAVWDWLHGTLRRDVPQGATTIGVADSQTPDDAGGMQDENDLP